MILTPRFDLWAKGLSASTCLPESDAPQNFPPLLFEFPFGILNLRKGQKHFVPDDEYRAAR